MVHCAHPEECGFMKEYVSIEEYDATVVLGFKAGLEAAADKMTMKLYRNCGSVREVEVNGDHNDDVLEARQAALSIPVPSYLLQAKL